MRIPSIRAIEVRFRAWRGNAPQDLTSYLARARVNLGDVSITGTGASGGDGVAASGDFTFLNDRPGSEPLHPSAVSSWNRPNPLLSPNRRLTLDVRATPEGEATGSWVTIFDGLLDSVRVRDNASRVEVRARDWAKVMQATMMPGDRQYGTVGGERFDNVIQQMLTDYVPNAPTLTVVGTPNFFVEPYTPAFGSVWDAAQELVTQVGWYLGMRRGPDGQYRLTLMDPPRSKTTADFVYTGDDVITADVDRSDRDVRNAFLVRYVDAATREPTQYPLAGPFVNQESVAALGGLEKLMVIDLGSTSQIGSAAEAQTLVERANHDLSSLFEGTQVTLPITPELNLFDTVAVEVEQIGNRQLFAVDSLQHEISIPASGGNASFRTTISGLSRVVGKRHQWLDLEVRPGSPNDVQGAHQVRLPPPIVSLTQGVPGFVVIVDGGPSARGVRAVGVEVHWSATNNFNPGPSTLRARGSEERFEFTNVTPGVRYYVRARSFDERGNYGAFSAQLSVVAARVEGEWLILDENVEIRGDFKVSGENVELDADTIIKGDFSVTGSNVAINANTTFAGNIRMLGGGSGNTANLEWYDGNTLKIILGQVPAGGFAGAPAGFIGLVGPLGTGVHIQGATEAVPVPFLTFNGTFPDVPPAASVTAGLNNGQYQNWVTRDLPQPRRVQITAFADTRLRANTGSNGNRLALSHTEVWVRYRTSPGGAWQAAAPYARTFTASWYQVQVLVNARVHNTSDSSPAGSGTAVEVVVNGVCTETLL